jgi:hypothetical protein
MGVRGLEVTGAEGEEQDQRDRDADQPKQSGTHGFCLRDATPATKLLAGN